MSDELLGFPEQPVVGKQEAFFAATDVTVVCDSPCGERDRYSDEQPDVN